mmetsp:Transcript_29072/g.46084  ORF Transcript_29072/g.46084 Transcript_29072/m.46084 type:complete len:377 (-) Transcript_29072:129-1259(-)
MQDQYTASTLFQKAFLYGVPGAQIALSSYLLFKAWSLSSKTKNQLKMKKKSIYSLPMFNAVVHRFCGGAFLVHSIYNSAALFRGKPVSKNEALLVFSIISVNTVTIFPLLADIAYTNTRIHRFFANSQYISLQFVLAAVSEVEYIYNGNKLTPWHYALMATEMALVVGLGATTMIDLIDGISIYLSEDKNNTILKQRESRSYQANELPLSSPNLRSKSSALDYNPIGRVMTRSYKKVFQKTRRNDSEEHGTSVKQHTAAVIASQLTSIVPVVIAAGRMYNKIYRNEKYVDNFEDFGRIARVGLMPFAFNIISAFSWTLFARGSVSHPAAKVLILTAFALVVSGPMYPMVLRTTDAGNDFKNWKYFAPATLVSFCMK